MNLFQKYSRHLLITLLLATLTFTAHAANKGTPTQSESKVPQSESTEHPLLDTRFPIQWSKITPEQTIIDINFALEQARKDIHAITQTPDDKLTFDNSFMALENIINLLSYAFIKPYNLKMLLNTEARENTIHEIQPKIDEFGTSVLTNEALYKKLQIFANSDAATKLTALQKRYMDRTLEEFNNQGTRLNAAQKKRLLEITTRLGQLSLDYEKNAINARNAWELIIDDPKKIEGLPELVADRLRLDALNRGLGSAEKPQWRLTLDFNNLSSEVTYIKDTNIRKQLWMGIMTLGTVAPYNNIPILIEILKLRQEKAQLLGEKNYADWVTHYYMMKNGNNALKFVEDLHSKILPLFHTQLQELANMPEKSSETIPNPWDMSYLINIKDRETHGFDSENYRPYIRMDDALKALFATDEKLFGIRIEEKPTFVASENLKTPKGAIEVWHPDVRFYEIYDNKNQHIGSFYGDWYSRDSKQSGAWMMSIQKATFHKDGTHTPNIALINSDATPPTATTPSLLSLSDLRTLFHEFGHLLHETFGNVAIPSMNGTNVAKDFVEFPSQFNEAFAVEPTILATFARHYQTGQPLSPAMLDAATKIEYSYSGITRMRQLHLAKLDLSLHTHTNEFTPETLDAFLEKNLADYMPKYPFKVPFFIGSINHLFSAYSYAASYYTYDWDNVLALDVFEHFKQNGLLNQKLGIEFKDKVLSRGDSEDPDVLYRNFMGRDPKLDAALKTYGLNTQ